jgi:putative lipoprotein
MTLIWTCVAALACVPVWLSAQPREVALAGTAWRLTAFDGRPIAPELKITLSFKEKQLGAKVCNAIGGSYSLSGSTLTGREMISTQMACMGPRDEIERALLNGLGKGLQVALEAGRLRLTGAHTFEFEPEGGAAAKVSKVTGTVTYRERMALPPDAELEVTLADVSRTDAPAVVVGKQVIRTAGKSVPIPFEIQYRESEIDPRHTYHIQARISRAGKALFISDQPYRVLTNGVPGQVELILKKARR